MSKKSDNIIEWIIEEWESAKKDFKSAEFATDGEKKIIILAKSLRTFINQVRTKTGIPEHYRAQGQKMADYLERELLKRDWDTRGVSHAVLLSIQYARKNLGASVIQGSALKSELSQSERNKLAKLTSRNPARPPKPQRAEDPDDSDVI
jgi:hypothetical protein